MAKKVRVGFAESIGIEIGWVSDQVVTLSLVRDFALDLPSWQRTLKSPTLTKLSAACTFPPTWCKPNKWHSSILCNVRPGFISHLEVARNSGNVPRTCTNVGHCK